MAQFKIDINKPGCGIQVYEQADSYTEDPVNRFVSYNPYNGVVIFDAIEDGDLYVYLAKVACPGFPEVVKQISLACNGSIPAPSVPSPSPSPSAPTCTPNYAICWSWSVEDGGDATCNDAMSCDFVDGHVGSTRLVSINNLGVGGRILKDNCNPFIPSDANFAPEGCNVFTIKRADLAVTYAVVSINSSGYIVDINLC